MSDCPHANQTDHVKEQGTEVVTWTDCDDCNAVLKSSRRSKFIRPRR